MHPQRLLHQSATVEFGYLCPMLQNVAAAVRSDPLHCCNLLAAVMQRVMDSALNVLLADAPRRSVLMIDTEKDGADGG